MGLIGTESSMLEPNRASFLGLFARTPRVQSPRSSPSRGVSPGLSSGRPVLSNIRPSSPSPRLV